MSYNTKNYTEQGGEKTVIGGTLEIKEEASVTGLSSAENQAASAATTVSALKDDFNALLRRLKDVGSMQSDTWDIRVSTIATVPSGDPHAEEMTTNQGKVSAVTIVNNVISIAVDVEELVPFSSSNPAQGTHKWVGILISTGLTDITATKYNGFLLSEADATEAASVGGTAGDIVMWLKCDEIATASKTFTLWTSGYAETVFTVVITEPAQG